MLKSPRRKKACGSRKKRSTTIEFGELAELVSAGSSQPAMVDKMDRADKHGKETQHKLQTEESRLQDRIQELEKRQRLLQRKEARLIASCEALSGVNHNSSSSSSSKSRKHNKSVVDLTNVTICEQIGRGASGANVFSAIVDGWLCALKELDIKHCNNLDAKMFEKEMSLYISLPPHPHVVRYLHHQVMQNKMRIFLAHYAGTLREYLDERLESEDHLSYPEAASIAFDIARAVSHLHQNNIVHRDIKSGNVFVRLSPTGGIQRIALGDLDTAKRFGVETRPTSIVGTPAFMAPEVLASDENDSYTEKVDVFSFGMFLYELMSLQVPYTELQSPVAIAEAVKQGKRPVMPPNVRDLYPKLWDLHIVCTKRDPEFRPSSAEVASRLEDILDVVEEAHLGGVELETAALSTSVSMTQIRSNGGAALSGVKAIGKKRLTRKRAPSSTASTADSDREMIDEDMMELFGTPAFGLSQAFGTPSPSRSPAASPIHSREPSASSRDASREGSPNLEEPPSPIFKPRSISRSKSSTISTLRGERRASLPNSPAEYSPSKATLTKARPRCEADTSSKFILDNLPPSVQPDNHDPLSPTSDALPTPLPTLLPPKELGNDHPSSFAPTNVDLSITKVKRQASRGKKHHRRRRDKGLLAEASQSKSAGSDDSEDADEEEPQPPVRQQPAKDARAHRSTGTLPLPDLSLMASACRPSSNVNNIATE